MRRSASSSAPLAAVLLATAVALGGCISTATYGTGESPEMAIIREVTGGIGMEKKEPIDYQPRAPLVMPPATAAGALPPPVDAAAVADPQWPDRPADETSDRFASDDPRDAISPEEARRLRPLAALNRDRGRMGLASSGENDHPTYDIISRPQERKEFRAAIDKVEGVGGERRYLTQPPGTLREPAPTAPTEFEDIKRKRSGFLGRLFGGG